MRLLSPAPQAGASAYSATRAKQLIIDYLLLNVKREKHGIWNGKGTSYPLVRIRCMTDIGLVFAM